MNKLVTWIVVLALILGAGWIYFYNNSQEPIVEESTEVSDESLASSPTQQCFYYSHEATPAEPYTVEEQVVLNIEGEVVSGTKTGVQSGPDMTNGYQGTLSGAKDGDMLEVDFAYTIEGSQNTETEIYEIQGDSLVKVRYALTEQDGGLVPDLSSTPTRITYTKIECEA